MEYCWSQDEEVVKVESDRKDKRDKTNSSEWNKPQLQSLRESSNE